MPFSLGQSEQNEFILVEGDRISSVGHSAPVGVPVIDLSGQTVLPGLIDVHDRLDRRSTKLEYPARKLGQIIQSMN